MERAMNRNWPSNVAMCALGIIVGVLVGMSLSTERAPHFGGDVQERLLYGPPEEAAELARHLLIGNAQVSQAIMLASMDYRGQSAVAKGNRRALLRAMSEVGLFYDASRSDDLRTSLALGASEVPNVEDRHEYISLIRRDVDGVVCMLNMIAGAMHIEKDAALREQKYELLELILYGIDGKPAGQNESDSVDTGAAFIAKYSEYP